MDLLNKYDMSESNFNVYDYYMIKDEVCFIKSLLLHKYFTNAMRSHWNEGQ